MSLVPNATVLRFTGLCPGGFKWGSMAPAPAIDAFRYCNVCGVSIGRLLFNNVGIFNNANILGIDLKVTSYRPLIIDPDTDGAYTDEPNHRIVLMYHPENVSSTVVAVCGLDAYGSYTESECWWPPTKGPTSTPNWGLAAWPVDGGWSNQQKQAFAYNAPIGNGFTPLGEDSGQATTYWGGSGKTLEIRRTMNITMNNIVMGGSGLLQFAWVTNCDTNNYAGSIATKDAQITAQFDISIYANLF